MDPFEKFGPTMMEHLPRRINYLKGGKFRQRERGHRSVQFSSSWNWDIRVRHFDTHLPNPYA